MSVGEVIMVDRDPSSDDKVLARCSDGTLGAMQRAAQDLACVAQQVSYTLFAHPPHDCADMCSIKNKSTERRTAMCKVEFWAVLYCLTFLRFVSSSFCATSAGFALVGDLPELCTLEVQIGAFHVCRIVALVKENPPLAMQISCRYKNVVAQRPP